MTVLAAEAIPAAAEASAGAGAGAGAASAAGAGRAAGGQATPPPKPGWGTSKGPRTRRPAQVRRVTWTPQPGQDGKPITIDIPGASVPEKTYHRLVMAEFVVCVVLVGASPFLAPGGPAGNSAAGVLAVPLLRLTAVCVLFFILALMAQGPRSGKIAAAFGALITLGLAFNSLPQFQAATEVFTGGAGVDTGPPASQAAGVDQGGPVIQPGAGA